MQSLEIGCRCLLGIVFLLAAVSKLSGRNGFRAFTTSIQNMRLLPVILVRPVALAVVAIEVAIPPLLAVPLATTAIAGFVVAGVQLTGFSVAIMLSLRRGHRVPCRCFGSSSLPLGPRHVVRNALLVGVAVLGVVVSVGSSQSPMATLVLAGGIGLILGGLVAALDDLITLFQPHSTAAREGTA
ncbi:MauE/DoxX family redox-associated membrane protein [Flindersiella endophytica]